MSLFQELDPQVRCLKMRERSLQKNARVGTMLEALRKLGCDPGPLDAFIQCASKQSHDGMAMTGGFESAPGTPRVVMIQEHLPDQSVFDRTLVHELIHAYDQCRAKVDWRNQRHIACSEIRASNLSGECEFLQEFNRGRLGFLKQQQTCVRRRAALSVTLQGVPDNEARQTVDSVYSRCYNDTAPFPQYHNRPAIQDLYSPSSLMTFGPFSSYSSSKSVFSNDKLSNEKDNDFLFISF